MDRIRAYIEEQPATLERTLEALPTLLETISPPTSDHGAIALVGSGTSRNALVATQEALASATGLPVEVMGPLGFLRTAPLRPLRRTLGVFVSQTGSSTTTVEALEVAQDRGMSAIAVTAEPASPFGRIARVPLVMPIGEEPIGPKTKGYTATVATMLGLARALAAPGASVPPPVHDPRGYAEALAGALDGWDRTARQLAADWTDVQGFMFLGTGRHLGTVLEASLKIQEMSGTSASAWDTEEGLHGRFHGMGDRDVAVFLAASPDEVDLAQGAAEVLAGLGVGTLVVVARGPEADASVELGERNGVPRLALALPGARTRPEADLLSVIVPFQYLADHLARNRGVDPDEMRYPRLSAKLGIKLAG